MKEASLSKSTKVSFIQEELRKEVLQGTWKEGDKLPGDAELAKRFDCSMGTVNRAVSLLAHDGLVVRRPRMGTHILMGAGHASGEKAGLDAFAFIYPTEQHEGIWRTVKGFQGAAAREKRQVVTLTFGTDYQKETELISRLREFDVRAAAIYPLISSPEELLSLQRMLLTSPFPLVIVGTALPGSLYPTVTSDDLHIGYAMTRHLLQGEAKRIGFLSNNAWVQVRRDMYRGYRWALDEAGETARPEWIMQVTTAHADFEDPLHEPTMLGRRYLDTAVGVEAVVCADDFLAQGLMRAAQERRLTVPGDIKVCGVDDNLTHLQNTPPLTTYRVPFEEIGAQAFGILQSATSGQPCSELEYHLRGTVVIREST